MDPSTLLNRPKTFNVIPKITKISNLSIASSQARKSSTKLVKVFEKGTYQKKTQLSVLNRYKKRLESIQKQNDRSFGRKRKVKVKLPDIKKYVGSFFTPGSTNDPLKAIGALAAFNAFQKGSKGDWGGALGSGLVAFGLLGGGALGIKGTRTLLKNRNAPTSPAQIGVPGASAGSFFGTPYAQTKAGKSYASMQQFRNLPQWAKGLSSSSASRFAASNERIIQGTANIGDRLRVGTRGLGMQGVGGMAENLATSGPPKITPRAGLLNVALFGLDYMGRKSEGQSNLQAGVGAGAGVGGALLGAAIGSMLFPGVGTVAGLLIGAAFSTGGALIASAIADKATGVTENKLKKQTQEQKALVEKKKDEGGKLTFSKTLNTYDKAVKKFEDFAKGFDFRESVQQTRERAQNVERLLGDQDIIEEPGYEFTNYTAQYLTGDPSSPAYDDAHGTSSNYHDHIAFNDRDMAIRAYQYLESKGLDVTEFQGFDAVEGHADGSYHYRGLAFDVPGYQWGATGPIDQRHYNGSRIVRKYLNEFFDSEKRNNPNLKPKTNTGTQQRTRPSQTPTTPSSLFQRPQTPGLSIGQGGFRINGTAAASLSQARPRQMPQISQQLSYQEGYSQAQPTIIPYPVVRQQQVAASASSAPMMFPGPSEQQLLNSFYKKVLLNTVQ